LHRDVESLAELKETEARLKELYIASRRIGGTWQATGAVVGLAGGIIAAINGALLSVGAWALGDESNGLSIHSVGNILLLSTIPLLLAGGHFLDLLDKRMVKSGRISSDHAEKTAKSNNHARAHSLHRPASLAALRDACTE
jgi:hypothetical protein